MASYAHALCTAYVVGVSGLLALISSSNFLFLRRIPQQRSAFHNRSFLSASCIPDTIGKENISEIRRSSNYLPKSIPEALQALERQAEHVAEDLRGSSGFYIASSGISFPIAMEAALELEEAFLVHAEGIQMEELMHRPLALATEGYNVLTIKRAETEALEPYEKILDTITLRGGHVNEVPPSSTVNLETTKDLSPLVSAIPFQLVAYKPGLKNGVAIGMPQVLLRP